MASLEEKEKTKISTAGSLNKKSPARGFTLVELVVVISIISLLLVFSFPLFKDFSFFSNSKSQTGKMVRLINELKKKSIQNHVDYVLNIDSDSGTAWISNDSMADEANEGAKDNALTFSENFSILGVDFQGMKNSENKEHIIRFRKQGYSDFALIHILENGNNLTLKIEPFLSKVQILNGHATLDDCI